MKKAKRKQKESEKRARTGWNGGNAMPLRLKSLSRRGPGEGRRQKFYPIQTRPSEAELAGGL